MFDEQRPGRIEATIWVAAYDYSRLACARCNSELFRRDVAFYTRTRPGDPFDPWCPECAHQMVRWAGAGALAGDAFDNASAHDKMQELIYGHD